MKFSSDELIELSTQSGGTFAVSSLQEAEQFCKRLATSHYENFPVGSLLVPKKFRNHFFNVYAFSRIADDLSDELIAEGKETQLTALDNFQNLLFDKDYLITPQGNPIFIALHQTMSECSIPTEVFSRLLVAFRQDVDFNRPVTMQDNIDYCHYSANPVGEVVLRIFGLWNSTTEPYSNAICTGLQLANFWQDISRDITIGRIYIPKELIKNLPTINKDNLHSEKNIGNFPSTLQVACEITESYFTEGKTLIRHLPYYRLRFEIALTIEGGRAILRKTKRLGSNILSKRPSLTGIDIVLICFKAVFRHSVFWRSMENNILVDYHTIESAPTSARTSFYYSFSFLPKDERDAINTVYSFCRQIDDIVDETPSQNADVILRKRQRLAWWRAEIEKCYDGTSTNPLLLPLAGVVRRFTIPKQYFLMLIDGCEKDLLQNRYETFDDLKEYCYSVASVVGLMCIEIFGYKYEETKEYAVNLGYALQLTNILRDVKADKDRGFIYLPKEDLERFRYTEEDLFNEKYNENFNELMRFEARRVREYYHKARTALRPDERVTMFAAEIMDAIYYRLLEKIELNDFNVFKKKIKVSTTHKFMIAIKHWLSTRIFVRRIKR